MAEFYFSKILNVDASINPDYTEDRTIKIILGPLDLMVLLFDDKIMQSKYNLIRGDEDLLFGVVTALGSDLQYINAFKPSDLIVFHAECSKNFSEHFCIVNSQVCIRLDRKEFKKRTADEPLVVKFEE